MIYPQDAKAFATIMDITWQSCGRNAVEKDTKSYWFGKLQANDLKDVEVAFDTWLTNQKELPTIADIIKLCRTKSQVYTALPAPLNRIENMEYSKEVVQFIAEQPKKKSDKRAWIKRIFDNPKNYPDISLKYAQEALAMKEST